MAGSVTSRNAAAAAPEQAGTEPGWGVDTRKVHVMPAKQEMPSTIRRSPKKAQRTWSKAHDSAVKEYGEGERAHRTALAASRPEVVDVAITQVFDLETSLGQTPRHDFLAALVGRGDGVARDEIEREIEGLRHRSALYGTGLRPARNFVTVG